MNKKLTIIAIIYIVLVADLSSFLNIRKVKRQVLKIRI